MATSVQPSALSAWFQSLRARLVDLVGDYAGQELFLVEGDSLLLTCFSDRMLDFEHGFQLLHAVYSVEYFLQQLVTRRCNFHIAFFEQHKHLCIPPGTPDELSYKYFLARAVIIRHLGIHLPGSHPSVKLHSFATLYDPAFNKYLTDAGVYFVMCHDGATPFTAGIEEVSDDAISSKRNGFWAAIWYFVSREFNVALIDELEWRDTKVMVQIIEGGRNTKASVSAVEKELQTWASIEPSNDRVTPENPVEGCTKSTLKEALQASPFSTERTLLTCLALRTLIEERPEFQPLALATLLHCVILSYIPLSQRRLLVVKIKETKTRTTETFLARFSSELIYHLQERSSNPSAALDNPDDMDSDFGELACDVADLIDGRLLLAAIELTGRGFKDVPQTLIVQVRKLGSLIGLGPNRPSKSGIDQLAMYTEEGHADNVSNVQKSRENWDILKVLPFSNKLFDQHLASIQLSVDKGSTALSPAVSRVFKDLTHWHNSRKKLKTKGVIHAEKDKWALRRNQFYMAEMAAYAASLTNAAGKILEPEIITSNQRGVVAKTTGSSSKSIEAEKSDLKSSGTKGSSKSENKKTKPLNSKEQILQKIAEQKALKKDTAADTIIRAWRTKREQLDRESDDSARYVATTAYLASIPRGKTDALQVEVMLYQVAVLLRIWAKYCRSQKKLDGYHVAALLISILHNLAKNNQMTKPEAGCASDVAKALAIPLRFTHTAKEQKLSFDFYIPTHAESLNMNWKEFQLVYGGPYLDRNFDSAPDTRVPFEPDGWQRKVLDEIDADRSVLVVAPTSAGKTFISFYAMEKILREGNDGVLVYLAPTKALVNQIAAEIQARFSKIYPYPGRSVWAVHTRDHRVNSPTGCQVLVTVPHVLQIMLLAPESAKTWAKKVRRIIFDEIHCIGNADDGLVWEQLLLLAPCPIIALSATIGNATEFSNWLRSTQNSLGNDLTLIQHPHRYSDLRKFEYLAPENFVFQGLPDRPALAKLGVDGVSSFCFIHPVTSLTNRSRGIPEDLSLEARDCFTLWKAMCDCQTATYPVEKELDPATAIPDIPTKLDIIQWEGNLKSKLRDWMEARDSPFERLIQLLGPTTNTKANPGLHVSDHRALVVPESENVEDSHGDYPKDTTLSLLCSLQERDALPAIFFNYDRSKCEGICTSVLTQLEKAEERWKENSAAWKKRIKGWEDYKKAATNKTAKKVPPKKTKAKGSDNDDDEQGSKLDMMKDAGSGDANPYASFDPNNPVDGFHFADAKKLLPSELEHYFWQLKRKGINSILMNALTRGIGVHHAGMNRKYRQVVEILFRKGYLRVVIATGTLALGINMPCSTVIFSGDSVFLTALNFRQAAGRAGRRGFDLLGNVIFQDVSTDKINRLLSSKLPALNGHFPLTTSLVLRLFSLLHNSDNSPFAVQAINSLLSQPRIYLSGPSFQAQVLHHLRFSIEYLRRQSLLDMTGAPLNFAGAVSHLYYTENSSFAFHALLKGGFLHQMCENIIDKPEEVSRSLMFVMSHLFGRRLCRRTDVEFKEKVVKKSPSMVYLPPLPREAVSILRQHNTETRQIFTTYVKTFIDQHLSASEQSLPLTNFTVGGQDEITGILPCLPPARIRSSFVALSGHGDEFQSISDLCSTVRSGVFLEKAVIPYMELYPDDTGISLNAYLLDFYLHGDTTALAEANGVRKAEVWFLLNDFSLTLAILITTLANYINSNQVSDLDMLDVQGGGDAINLLQDDKAAEVEGVADGNGFGQDIQAAQQQTSILPQRRKKEKVLDTWDDGDSSEGESIDGSTEVGTPTESDVASTDTWVEDGKGGLKNILLAFQTLRVTFDAKFKAMWA